MKKLLVVFFVALCAFSCFANVSTWTKKYYVDDFGDPTNQAYLLSESIKIKHGSYSWDEQYCSILVDDNGVSFKIGTVYYTEWTIKTKTASGETHTFKGELGTSTGRVLMSNYSPLYSSYTQQKVDTFISDILQGSRVILMPDNPYTSDKYDFGTVTLSLEDLKQVRPNWQ